MADQIVFRGELVGHGGWVTSIATSAADPNTILTSSRDKTVIVWTLTREEGNFGYARRALRGHNNFVSDVVVSADGQFALSSSWDHTLRLWEIATGKCKTRFAGHTKDVLSVAFSEDNRQIISGSRDRTVKLWNTVGECKYTCTEGGHNDWVSCVRFPPVAGSPNFVSAGWDNVVKIWSTSSLKNPRTLAGHTGYLNTVTVSPDGSLCASGGKDNKALLWDLSEGKLLYTLDAEEVINALVFSPVKYWLVAATNKSIKIWDLESKNMIDEIKVTGADGKKAVACTSLAWSSNGEDLFAGFADNIVRVYSVLTL